MSDDEPTTPVPTHVEIGAGGHQIVIDAGEPLIDVAKVALELWRATDDKALTRGYGTSVGFHTELSADPTYDGEPDRLRIT